MRTFYWRVLFSLSVLLLPLLPAGGCRKNEARRSSTELASLAELGPTVGSVAEVVNPAVVTVEGYGLVGGLAGTGSAYCPPQVRAYLRQYILTQLPDERVNVDELINSKKTAVVVLEGEMPAMPSKDDRFDVRVALVPGSEATSIRGGWLYKADLVPQGTFGIDMRALAAVEGRVFINPIGTGASDLRNGYVLGGGRVLHDFAALLRLRKPNFRMASLIRNRLSERYGPNIARALSASDIEIRVPPQYLYRKPRFVSVIPATPLEVTPESTQARVSALVHQLAVSDDKGSSEVGLEAIGRESLAGLGTLVNAADAEVRLRAARCMLSLRDDRGLGPLRDLAMDKDSPYRLEALDAVVASARRDDASALAQRLLRDSDASMIQAAYEHLRRMEDPAVTREVIGRSFSLEEVVQTDRKAVFVARSGDPRIVLFGAPLKCHDNVFVESPVGTIIVNSRAGQDYLSVFRGHPTRPGVLGPIKTSPDLHDLIHVLASEPSRMSQGRPAGLGASYAEVIALLEQLSAKEAMAAEFWAGPLPKTPLKVKK